MYKPIRSQFLPLLLTVLCAANLSAALATPAAPDAFKSGDRWSVVGDSVTQSGTYYAWVYLYYATRFPGLHLDVANCGISGDSASGALRRYPWDIQPKHGTVATIMMGMNDVNRGLYSDATPSPEILTRRATALADYQTNMTKLAGLLKADGARLIFMSPSPFDETVNLEVPRQTGVNGALAECGKIITKLASETGGTMVDLNGPMTALNLRLQAADPAFTLVGPDRIHPRAPGHFVMAYFFLKAQNAPADVSRVVIDAASSRATQTDNAEVSGITHRDGGLEFKCLEKALPYPVGNDVSPALAWVPFTQDFNQEILRVTGLTSGTHTLFIDGEKISSYDAGKFASGINLAEISFTPQARQATQVLDLVRKWQALVSNGERGVAQVEHFVIKELPRPIDFNAAKPILEEKLAKLQGSDAHMDKYNSFIIKRYLDYKPKEAQTQAQLTELADQIRATAQPQAHVYRIVP